MARPWARAQLLRRQARAVLRLAAAPDPHYGGRASAACTPSHSHALTDGFPGAATADGDKGHNAAVGEETILAETGVRPVPLRKATHAPMPWPTG